MNRRNFVNNSILTVGAVTMSPAFLSAATPVKNSLRPPITKRLFKSEAVEQEILRIKKDITDPEISWLFENCYPNTLDTTVHFSEPQGVPDSFIITGDINAMWMRDSTAQVWPYLHLADKDEQLKKLFKGLINRQIKCILIDSYANAFNFGPTGSEWKTDLTEMKPALHERKWEIDSLCYPVRLSYHYWKLTGDKTPFGEQWLKAAKSIVKTFQEQQRLSGKGPYHFMRVTSKQTDTVIGDGYGNPVKPNGLICSTFRPSDDATTFLYLIPSNFFALTSLRQMAELVGKVFNDQEFVSQCNKLADTVEKSLNQYAVANHLNYGKIYAFEIDGFGNSLYMDDANIPSLLAMPYLGSVKADDEVYLNTRRFVLSKDNPWFYEGKAASGVGGPHCGAEMIWPMSIITRAMTSGDDKEITQCLRWLKNTHAGKGFMHESFHMDNAEKFTRSWFAWANTLFGELILKIHKERKHLLNQIL
jgi:meiotically up-regulated gene 157 (Mug157) protein